MIFYVNGVQKKYQIQNYKTTGQIEELSIPDKIVKTKLH